MNINVQVKNAWINVQKLDNGQHNVVYVTETACLRFLGMVQPACPVDGDIRLPVEQQASSVNRGPRGDLAKVVEAIEGGTVGGLADLESLSLLKVLKPARVGGGVGEAVDAHAGQLAGDVLADELLEVVEVVLRVEAPHLITACLPRVVDVQVPVESSVDNQGVRHGNALRLHRMLL